MPWTCFSYPADLPPGTGNSDAAQPAPPGLRRMPAGPCFSYPHACFSYPADTPPGGRTPDAAGPVLPDLRKMPSSICFRY